jgi:hypothetical protein
MSGPLSKWFKLPTLAERLRAQGVREDVIAAAEITAFGRQTDKGLPDLGRLLTDDEGVVALVEARHQRAMGLLVLTTRRLLFDPSASDRGAVVEIDLAEVLALNPRMHRGLGVLEVRTPAGTVTFDQILGHQAETLAGQARQAAAPPPDGPAVRRDPLDELAELRLLHRAGAIGEAEYQARKKQLFGQI